MGYLATMIFLVVDDSLNVRPRQLFTQGLLIICTQFKHSTAILEKPGGIRSHLKSEFRVTKYTVWVSKDVTTACLSSS